MAWGLYYSTLITISVAFHPEFEKLNKFLHINTECYSWKLFQMVRTFCCFMGGRLLTSPGGLRRSLMVIENILTNFAPWKLINEEWLEYGIDGKAMFLVMVSIVVLWAVSMMQERFSVREKLAEQNIVFRWGVIYIAIFSILIFGAYGKGFDPAAFIYTQY